VTNGNEITFFCYSFEKRNNEKRLQGSVVCDAKHLWKKMHVKGRPVIYSTNPFPGE
jgi:hypothetical protein